MWARKASRSWLEQGVGWVEEEYVEVNRSWYDVLSEGLYGLWIGGWMVLTCLFVTPVLMVREAYREARYKNCPVPNNECRERAHLG